MKQERQETVNALTMCAICHTHAHTRTPATFVHAAHSLAHGVPTLENVEKKTTRRVATVAGVENKNNTKSFLHLILSR